MTTKRNKRALRGGAGSSAIGTVYKSGAPGSSSGTPPRGSLGGGRANSALVYPSDPGNTSYPLSIGSTETKYAQNSYVAATEVQKYSYTSARVAKRVYNTYTSNDYQVTGYMTDWAQYDGRYEGLYSDSQCGRGFDTMLYDNNGTTAIPYDKLIVGFVGIVGDTGEKSATITQGGVDFGRTTNQATFTDAWGDVASYRNCGFSGWVSNDYQALFQQDVAQGILGALRLLKTRNPNLILSFSLGGWTMSEAFHWVARDAAKRQTLASSVAYIFQQFPMFSEIDVDWEYPGASGNDGNTYSDDDEIYYRLLIQDIVSALKSASRSDVKISIATSANVPKMEKANLKGMLDAGVWGFNVMTYDFFGTPWATELAHHTNLYPSHPDNEEQFSVEAAIQYILAQGIPSKQVFIGYAGYSRSARGAAISSFSPLTGTYDPGTGTTTGTFESGVTEYYDLLYNYADFENKQGLNGFSFYTDLVADADYLYNPTSKLFLSIDTPRSVKAKGQYAQKYNLGGLMTWTTDHDNGILVNAAREGLGNTISSQVIDMSPFYFYGVNVAAQPTAVITGSTTVVQGGTISLSGASSTAPDGGTLTYLWSATGLSFNGATTATVTGTATTAGTYAVSLTVTDASGNQATTSATITVTAKAEQQPTAVITGTVAAQEGDTLSLSGANSTAPDGGTLTYLWSAPGLSFDGSTHVSVSGIAPTAGKSKEYPVSLTVTDQNGNTDTASQTIYVTVQGEDTPPVANIKVQLPSGTALTLSGNASYDPDGDDLTYSWSTSPAWTGVNGATTESVAATVPTVTVSTSYAVSLTVDDGEESDTASVFIEAVPAGTSSTVQAVITGALEVQSGDTISLSGSNSTGSGSLTYKWTATGLSFTGSTLASVSGTAPTVTANTSYPITLTVTDATGASNTTSATLVVKASSSASTGTWDASVAYTGGSTVTHNYNNQGLHKYTAQWWTQGEEPGNPAYTGTTGSGKVWLDNGATS